MLSCGIYCNVIRFLAPLTISDALLKEGFNLLRTGAAGSSEHYGYRYNGCSGLNRCAEGRSSQ